MTVKTDTLGTGAFLLSEANGTLSREAITLAANNGVILAGTVLGKVTATGKHVPYDNDATSGAQTAVAILLADADTTGGDVRATGIVRQAEVWKSRLIWGAAVTTEGEKTAAYADFAAVGIVAR